jgi:ATP-binding protein involved in chromosome partitioning
LSISQNLKVNGAIIVSTPQDIALLDARRAIEMFKKVNVKILGLVQNMSSFSCSNCGHVDHIFGEGGAKKLASQVDCDYLGDVVLNTEIRRSSDAGEPISILNESHPGSIAYKSICEKIIANY